jgi:hypothetical protein
MTQPGSAESRHARACEVFSRFVPGVEPERVFASLERRLGALGSFGFDVVGDLWAQPASSRRDRSLLVVSVLSAQARDEELELQRQSDAGRARRLWQDRRAIGRGEQAMSRPESSRELGVCRP